MIWFDTLLYWLCDRRGIFRKLGLTDCHGKPLRLMSLKSWSVMHPATALREHQRRCRDAAITFGDELLGLWLMHYYHE